MVAADDLISDGNPCDGEESLDFTRISSYNLPIEGMRQYEKSIQLISVLIAVPGLIVYLSFAGTPENSYVFI